MNMPSVDSDSGFESAFAEALEGVRSTGASPETRELVELLVKHGRDEAEVLRRYQDVVDRASVSDGSIVGYLVALILDDERRHHRLLAELANAVAWGSLRRAPVPSVPSLFGTTPRNGNVHELTRALLATERRDRRELHRLRKRLRDYEDTTLWPLVVEIMALDTEKHIRILEFLAHHTG